jgi:hypothetical protein
MLSLFMDRQTEQVLRGAAVLQGKKYKWQRGEHGVWRASAERRGTWPRKERKEG